MLRRNMLIWLVSLLALMGSLDLQAQVVIRNAQILDGSGADAIVGDVFDVTSGKQHYGARNSYAHFAGRDATRSFATGETDAESLTDDVTTLDLEELQGVAARGCYDLTQHQEASGKSLEYVDQASGRKYVPQVVEPSIGVDRLFLAAICSAYAVDEVGGAERTLLKFSPLLAPVKAAVLPLSKKDPALLEIARRTVWAIYRIEWEVVVKVHYTAQDLVPLKTLSDGGEEDSDNP